MTKEEELKEAINIVQKILSEKKTLLTGDLDAAVKLLEKHDLKEAVSVCRKIADAEARVVEYADEQLQPLFFELKEVVIGELKKEE